MNTSHISSSDATVNPAGINSLRVPRTLQRMAASCMAILSLCLLLAPSAQAQFVRFVGGQLRVTVPVNTTSNSIITNKITLNGINGSGASLSFSGLPAGAGATVTPNPATATGALTVTVSTTNVAEGVYTFSLNATATDTNGAAVTGNILYTLQVGYFWNGGTNVVLNGTSSYSDSTKWLGGVTPGAADDILFTDLGGQTNSLINTAGVTNFTANIAINSNTTNGSWRFSTTNAAKFYTFQLAGGVTMALTGANGFSLLRDYLDSIQGIGNGITVTVAGTNGATLIQSNETSIVNTFLDNSVASLVDLSQLDNYVADVKQFALGDFQLYPNFFNFDLNNTGTSGLPAGVPRQSLGSFSLAKTNNIKAIFSDPFNYTNSDSRRYSLSFMNSELSGSSTAPVFNFGISNSFQVDSVNLVGGNSRGNVQFNPNLAVTTNISGGVTNLVTNTMAAYFRGTNGGRMNMFCVADGGDTNAANSNLKTTINFSGGRGVLNVLADRFIIGRDRVLIASNNTPNYQGTMTMGNGLIDVNTAIFGFREHHQTNTYPPTFPTVPNFNGYCEGQLTIVSNGVLKVNNSLTLGSTVATLANELGSGGNTEYGEVILQNGASLIANQVNVGGPVYGASANNYITLNNNCSLVLSNTIGGPLQSLDKLAFTNSSLTMNIDGTNAGPYIYTTNLSTSGTNAIVIASIKHLSSITGPIQLISFSAGAGSFNSVVMPAGLNGALVTTNNVGIYLTVITGTPKHLLWVGNQNAGAWDLTTANWKDLNTGLTTNFSTGDFVAFDDTSSVPTVNLSGGIDLIPSGMTMTNSLNYYTFNNNGGGDIQGSATFFKTGSNGLEIDAPTSVSVIVNQGYLVGSNPGAVGSANIPSGTLMNFSGNIASGLTVGGNANFSGTGAGTLSVLTTGVVTNAGEWDGGFVLASNAVFYNNGNLGTASTYNAVGNLFLATNATLINNGSIHALTLTVDGTLVDAGAATGGSIYMYGDTPTGTRGVTIDLGGNFVPGGYGIGTTIVRGQSPSPYAFPGRLLFAQGSTNVFKIDVAGGSNTLVYAAYMGWGPNESTPAYNGGTLLITNVSGTPFSAGQGFILVSNIFGGALFNAGLNTTNALPVVVPPTPGPGLAWDLSKIIQNGVIGVIGVNTNSTSLGLSTFSTTVISTNGAGSTNQAIVSELTWPADHIGWKLQSQSDALSVGLTTNWTLVPNSGFTNDVLLTNIITTNGTSIFYRMIFP